MDPKRQAVYAPTATPQSSFSQLIDENLTQQLATVGSRVRKQVSEGHLTPGSLPSFQGDTVGPLDQDAIRRQIYGSAGPGARPYNSMSAYEESLKRNRTTFDEDDDTYGDTDADEEPQDSSRRIASLQRRWAKEKNLRSNVELPTRSSSEHKTYFVPAQHGSSSVHEPDFEDAPFLQPPPQ